MQTARRNAVDPLAEVMPQWSAYSYAFNNPLRFIAPDGRMPLGRKGDPTNDRPFGQPDYNSMPTFDLPEVTVTAPRSESKGNGSNDLNVSGLATSLTGTGLTAGSITYFDNKGGTWTGKNFKTYSTSWGGNQYTGGKHKFAREVSRGFTGAGYGLGLINAVSVHGRYQAGESSDFQYGVEQGANALSTFGGLYGAAFGIGWELGRGITNLSGYHENVRLPLQRFFGIIPPQQDCYICPE